MKSLSLPHLWLSGLGTGYLPVAPATWGSALGFVGVAGLSSLPWAARLIGLSIALVLTVWALSRIKAPTHPDPPWMVADEIIAGLLIAFIYPLQSSTELALGFVFFRFWDIVKLWPADVVEALPYPWGIFMDDVVAAFYTLLSLWVVS